MQPLDPRIERIAHSGMYSVFIIGEGYSRFDTLEAAQAFLAERDLSEASQCSVCRSIFEPVNGSNACDACSQEFQD